MYDCLICNNDSNGCDHLSYATLGNLFYVVRKMVASWPFEEWYSALAKTHLVLDELRIGHTQGNHLVTLTTEGRLLVLANIPKVLRELVNLASSQGWDSEDAPIEEHQACMELMITYMTLEELPQFLTSDSNFLRDLAEKRFQELTAGLNSQEKDHIDRLVI